MRFPQVAQPVPRFNHSRRAPLIVLAAFEDGRITHVGDARKGMSAGTDLVRLNMLALEPLAHPITFERIVALLPSRFRGPLKRVVETGGILPPKTMKAVAA